MFNIGVAASLQRLVYVSLYILFMNGIERHSKMSQFYLEKPTRFVYLDRRSKSWMCYE